MTLIKTVRNFSMLPVGILILIFAALLVLSGCWVESVNGLDEGGFVQRDPDVVFDKALTGVWQETHDNCTMTLTVSAEEQRYDFKAMGRGEKCDDSEKAQYYRARLIKLDNHRFLDMFPRPDDVCEMCLPLHWIFLVNFDKDSLSLTPIDDEWLKRALEQKTVTLETVPGNTDRLTASAKDLKAFCRKYADNKEAFKPVPKFVFKRKQV